jgi:DEAD/DEAH box helicase domain-containing protein
VTNADYFFDQSPEHGRINPDNLVILLSHIQCAAFELPFREGESFGGEDLEQLLRYLEDSGVLHRAGDRWHWSSDTYPADEISIRHISSENFVVVDTTDRERVIAEVDYSSAFTTIYEGAIYINEGEQYHVDRLDHDRRKAYVHSVRVNYYTDAISSTRVRILEMLDGEGGGEGAVGVEWGEVEVREKAEGFKKIRFYTQENLGYGEIALPEQELHTTGFWVTLPYEFLSRLDDDRDALVDGLLGVAYAMHTVSCLLLMCEYRDLGRSVGDRFAEWYVRSSTRSRGVYSSARPDEMLVPSPTPSFRPTIFLYDNCPGGVGFSELLFSRWKELVERGAHLVKGCACDRGCPSCVGPVVHGGDRSREAAVAIFERIMGEF